MAPLLLRYHLCLCHILYILQDQHQTSVIHNISAKKVSNNWEILRRKMFFFQALVMSLFPKIISSENLKIPQKRTYFSFISWSDHKSKFKTLYRSNLSIFSCLLNTFDLILLLHFKLRGEGQAPFYEPFHYASNSILYPCN